MNKPFDAFEIALVGEYNDPNGGDPFCEVIHDEEDKDMKNLVKTYWTVYGHREGEGVVAIGDFSTQKGALSILSSILGREVEMGPRQNWASFDRNLLNDEDATRRPWSAWKLANDVVAYGENAGKTIIVDSTGETEITSVVHNEADLNLILTSVNALDHPKLNLIHDLADVLERVAMEIEGNDAETRDLADLWIRIARKWTGEL